ncbi:MAG: COG1470 family protein [Candidatus Zipacnadales bacterium]
MIRQTTLRGPTTMRWNAQFLLPFLATNLIFASCTSTTAEETLVNSFESDTELAAWQITAAGYRLVSEGATHGQKALEMMFDPNGEYFPAHMYWNRVIRDWTPYDALLVNVLNPNDFPIPGEVLVADQAWEDSGRSYWNRHNGSTTFAPGAGTWIIPVKGLYRGEAGSRNNDIKRDIDADSIVRLDLAFGRKGQRGRVIVDNIRFVKVSRPEGIYAFDFGPPSQPVMLGWTPVSHETGYTPEAGYGWSPPNNRPWNGAARDTTFGPMLTQDFCEAGGYSFHVDCPSGLYDCLVIFENCGYWGGEQARHSERHIFVNDELVWSEKRPDGPSTALFRFEDVEPVSVDLWETYMAVEITKPVRFQASSSNGGLTFRFAADQVWGSKVAALALCRADASVSRQWLEEQLSTLAAEFRAKAVCLDPAPPTFVSDQQLVAWPVQIEDEVTPNSVPSQSPQEVALRGETVRGEYEPLCLAIRPMEDLGKCRVELKPGENWPVSTVQVVRYNTRRGFGSLAYRIAPHTLRDIDNLDLPAGITREIVVTANITADTVPGTRQATLSVVNSQGAELLRVPLSLTVHEVLLNRDTAFLMGFFGLEPPESLLPEGATEAILDQTLLLLQAHGMNAVSGGPNWRLTGWHMGIPQVDFGECDAFFERLRKYGFNKAINGYGGLRFLGLHDGYQKGETGRKVEQESGLDYETAVLRAWEVVAEHARQHKWPTIFYAMCDETRVREVAERELEFMRIMAKVCERFPDVVQPSGAYSVTFQTRPTDENDLLLWHQRFFEVLPVSSLNNHDDSVMTQAQQLKRQIHIYNQGQTRYSFGLYQWSEYQKGVAARWQWHLNVLHGYQFFDLDGREPDTAMICYGRKGIYPTIQFERCREGAEDFYLLQTLANQIAANTRTNRKPTETQAADRWLTELTSSIALNQRDTPTGYDAQRMKIEAVRLLEQIK